MARLMVLVAVLLVLCAFCCCERREEEHQYETAVLPGEESNEGTEEAFPGPGEEITMSMDEFKEKFGGRDEGEGASYDERSDRHMLGMCWQSEMARCVNGCQEKSNEELLPTFVPFPSILDGVERVREELVEVCASYCQADVSYSCTQLNLAYGGTKVFKFGGKWPMGRLWAFCEAGAVATASFAALVQCILLLRFRRDDSVLTTLLGELSAKIRAQRKSDNSLTPSRREGETTGTEGEEKSTENNGSDVSEGEEEDTLAYPYAWAWYTSHFLYVAAFLSLALYHTVDTMMTEAIAFMTVGIAVLYRLYLTVIFVLSIRDFGLQIVTFTPIGGLLFFHIFRMLNVEFDYPFHRSLLTVSLECSALLWIAWFLLVKTRHENVTAVIKAQACLVAAAVAWLYVDLPPILDWTTDYHAVCYVLISGVLLFEASFSRQDYRAFYRGALLAHKKTE